MRTQIVSRAILKRENQRINDIVEIPYDDVSKILGCYVLNVDHTYKLEKHFGVILNGCYDVNLWLTNKEQSKTVTIIERKEFKYKTNFEEVLSLGNETLSINFIEEPNCKNAFIDNGIMKVEITYVILIELIGDRKFYVEVSDDEIDDLVDNSVNEDYIKEKMS